VSATVYLELLTSSARTTRLEVASELRDRSTNRVVEGRQRGLEDRVLDILAQSPTLTRTALRDSLSFKNERLGEALVSLELLGRLCCTPVVGNVATDRSKGAVPVPHRELRGNGTVVPSTEPSYPVSQEGSCQASTSTESAPRSRWSEC
jgi:hypothetical protein